MNSKTKSLLLLLILMGAFETFALADEFRFKARSNEVLIPLKVSAAGSKDIIKNLKTSNLKISDNGNPQTIRSVWKNIEPFNLMVLLDISDDSSERLKFMSNISKQMAKVLRHSRNNKNFNNLSFALYGCTHSMTLTPPTSDLREIIGSIRLLSYQVNFIRANVEESFSRSRNDLSQTINEIKKSNCPDGAYLPEALHDVRESFFMGRAREQNAIIVISNTDSLKNMDMGDLESEVQRSPSLIYTIQLINPNGAENGNENLKELSIQTGGTYYSADVHDQKENLKNIFEKINTELGDQYVTSYSPSAPTNGAHEVNLAAFSDAGDSYGVKYRKIYYLEPKVEPPSNATRPVKTISKGSLLKVKTDFTLSNESISTAIQWNELLKRDELLPIIYSRTNSICNLQKSPDDWGLNIDLHQGEELVVGDLPKISSRSFETVLKRKRGRNPLRINCFFPEHPNMELSVSDLEHVIGSYLTVVGG